MKINTNSALPPTVYADASVHSIGGESIFTTTKSITSKTVEHIQTDPFQAHYGLQQQHLA
ncbi:hypothetical protein OB986_23750 [Bacillus cereus]|nr:hypothetical protein [Bacillus cereus]